MDYPKNSSATSAQPPLITLKEALQKRPGTIVSVLARVQRAFTPAPSRGTDHYLRLYLTDPSVHGGAPDHMNCMMFGPMHLLPKFEIEEPMCIIHLHHAKIQKWSAELQLFVKLKEQQHPQDGDTLAIYSVPKAVEQAAAAMAGGGGGGGGGFEAAAAEAVAAAALSLPIHLSHPRAPLPIVSPELLGLMRRWITQPQQPADAPIEGFLVGGGPTKLLRIAEVRLPLDRQGGYPTRATLPVIDMICRVLSVDLSMYPNHFVLHVWDGTDALPLPLWYTSEPMEPPHHKPQHHQPPLLGSSRGAGGGGSVEDRAPTQAAKRTRVDVSEVPPAGADRATTVDIGAQYGAVTGAGGGFTGGVELQPHRSRYVAPLASVVQYGGPQGSAAAVKGMGIAANWEVLAAALAHDHMPLAGSIVPLVLPSKHYSMQPGSGIVNGDGGIDQRRALPRPGEWLELKNVEPRFVQGQPRLSYSDGSSILTRTAHNSAAATAAYEARLAAAVASGGRCLVSYAPKDPEMLLARAVRSWQALPLRTLREVLLQQHACDVTPCRVLARVVHVLHPPQPVHGHGVAALPAADMRTEAELPPGHCLDRGNNGLAYALALLLEDTTAQLRAVLVGGAANLFLWDMPPSAAPHDPEPVEQQKQQQPLADATESMPVAGGLRTHELAAQTQVQTQQKVHAAATASAPALIAGAEGADGNHDRLRLLLYRLSDQREPNGAWIECVLRPLYRDRHNPWQTAVYSMEHTMLRLPAGAARAAAPASHMVST